MTFVLRMWWREVRSSWSRLAFFFICVGIGVAAIVVLRSVVQQVRVSLTSEARSLLGADLVLQSPRPMTGPIGAQIDAALAAAPAVRATTSVVDTQTMASPGEGQGNDQVKLVEVRGVEAAYPFYGSIELDGGRPYSHALLKDHGALVQPELLAALGVAVGDEIRMAGQRFTIRGTIARERAQRNGIAFGPRVFVDLADLEATSLLGFGSRATYQRLAKIEDEAALAPLTAELRTALRQEAVGVRNWRTLEDRIGENLDVAENYLSLVGFAMVVLGGIGVWSVTRVIVQQKMPSVAILKCIGATSGRVLSIYVLQVLTLAAAGGGIGLALAAAALAFVPAEALASFGVAGVSVTPSAAVQGVAVGLLVSLLFALVPLLEIREVKPLLLLRAGTAAVTKRRDWRTVGAAFGVGLLLVLVAMWQAHSVRAGLFVAGGLAAVACVLDVASRLLIRAARRLSSRGGFALRHAVISLGRPGNQTRAILMVVGLGCFFVLGIRALQGNLLAHLSDQVGPNSPDFVVIDVQADQVASLREVVRPFLRSPARIAPLMRGRVVAVEGREAQLRDRDAVREVRGLSREFGMTFRSELEPNERLLAGTFWPGPLGPDESAAGADTEVSVEREIARDAHLTVGDVITFDVAGQRLTARVGSVRAVAWENSQNGGFVFVLRPAPAVERLAHNYVGFLQAVDDPAARGRLQRDVVKSHPNVSLINVRDILDSVRDVLANVTFGVTVVGAVTLASGALILAGAIVMTRFQRQYDAAIYRTLGASTRLMTTMLAIEYAMLGALAGLLGAIGALALSWGLAVYLFDIEWRPDAALLGAGVFAAAAVVCLVGVAASLDVLVKKPLATLRS
ncbi:MAG: ABC transporter permease [Acidobacteria bacterium]|nr:ABC transporter permease [Acidobacteriota bacterium]